MNDSSTAKPEPQAVFTPALKAVWGDLVKYLEASCYLVVSHNGWWSRGKSVEKAAEGCLKQGSARNMTATVLLILGDETAEISETGNIIRSCRSYKITLFERIRLGALIPSIPGQRKEKT